MRIWKELLPLKTGAYPLHMGKDCKIMSIGIQNNMLAIWREGYDDELRQTRNIIIKFTGDNLPSKNTSWHIGTLQHEGLVYHIFETL